MGTTNVMRHLHFFRFFHESPAEHGHGHGGHPHHGHHHHPRGGGRLFDYGELRLLVLALLAEAPRHGYELIKAIGERSGGSYTPSPGVIYPTLSWLEDMGYAAPEAVAGNRKRYVVTDEGTAFLQASRAACDALLQRINKGEGGAGDGAPDAIMAAMQLLKGALRRRFRQGPPDAATAARIAAAIEAAARVVEADETGETTR